MDILISYRLIRENLHLQLWGEVVHQTTSPVKLVVNAESQPLRANSTDKDGNNYARSTQSCQAKTSVRGDGHFCEPGFLFSSNEDGQKTGKKANSQRF